MSDISEDYINLQLENDELRSQLLDMEVEVASLSEIKKAWNNSGTEVGECGKCRKFAALWPSGSESFFGSWCHECLMEREKERYDVVANDLKECYHDYCDTSLTMMDAFDQVTKLQERMDAAALHISFSRDMLFRWGHEDTGTFNRTRIEYLLSQLESISRALQVKKAEAVSPHS